MLSVLPMLLHVGNDYVIYLLVFGPALLGVVALIFGLSLLRRAQDNDDGERSTQTLTSIGAVLCLLLALGIGGCYAVMYLN